ncbi:MAG: hypothetical protein R3B72_33910 [Polyangiaceae bacterium]
MPRLDPQDLRRYAEARLGGRERLARREARLGCPWTSGSAGIALYEAAKATNPEWPYEATRRADLDAHLRVKHLLHEAADVGAG